MNLALETAVSLKSGACWINCHNLFDAASGFGGYRESGFGRDRGKEVSIVFLLGHVPNTLCTIMRTFLYLSQGLYEYVKPSWQTKPHPQINDEKVKNFGQNVAPRPLNPSQKEAQLYPVTMEIAGIQAPRSVTKINPTTIIYPLPPSLPLSIDRTLKMYIGGTQKRPDAPYCRPVKGAGGGVVGQVAEGNRKDIREAVEAAHNAAPGSVTIYSV